MNILRAGRYQPAILTSALLFGVLNTAAQAQAPDMTPALSSSMPTRVWVSGGLGPAGYKDTGGISLRASAAISVGRAAVMVRTSESFEGSDGHTSIGESAVLAGMRFGGKYLYVIPAVGVSNANWHNDHCTAHFTCTPAEAAQYDSKGPGLAYDVGFHASRLIAGMAFNIGGIAAPEKRRLLSMVLSFELGWFDR